jgi:hypothetical protein
LLKDDAHWDKTLGEAPLSDSPHKICKLFAIMLVFCQVADPVSFWGKYRNSLAEDVRRNMARECGESDNKQGMDLVFNKCLVLREDLVFSMFGHFLQQYGQFNFVR